MSEMAIISNHQQGQGDYQLKYFLFSRKNKNEDDDQTRLGQLDLSFYSPPYGTVFHKMTQFQIKLWQIAKNTKTQIQIIPDPTRAV